MLSNALEKGEYSETILGRLIDVSEKNPNFTKEDIFAETATILTGVTIFALFATNINRFVDFFMFIISTGFRYLICIVCICDINVGNPSKVPRKSIPRNCVGDAE